jgi:hypothetical protein
MAEDRKTRYEREKRAQAYKDFIEWAEREVCNEIIRGGFGGVRGAIERILQLHEHYKKENPQP